MQKVDSSFTVPACDISGILLGPQTITFQNLIKKKRIHFVSERYWSFVSIVTINRTYDFQFFNREDVVDFYIAVNEAVANVKPRQLRIMSIKYLRMHLIKMKLEHIAEMQGLSLIQLFKKSLYIRG